MLLLAGYQSSDAALAQYGDPTGMKVLGFKCEWVDPSEFGEAPWSRAHYAFRVEAEGENWHIVHYADRDAVFTDHLE